MRKTVVALAIAAASLAAHAWALGVEVDQSQPVVDVTKGGLGIGGFYQQKLAQVVTAGREGTLAAVRFPVLCFEGDLISVEIQSVTGVVPDGKVLGVGKYLGTRLATADAQGFETIAVTPVQLSVGDRFAIVLSSADSASCGIPQGPVGDTYLGGDAFFDARPSDPGWVSFDYGPTYPRDLPFETVMLVS